MTSTDNHRSEMVANNNVLAEFYNWLNDRWDEQTDKNGAAAADIIDQYTVHNSTHNGAKPNWIVLNEISPSRWPANATYRQWIVDVATRLHDTYGYNVITYSPFANPSSDASDWQALAAKSYIGIENYLSGQGVLSHGTDYASRVAWAQAQYDWSQTAFGNVGVSASRLFLGEDFSNTAAGVSWGRAGISAADWDMVIQIRQDAIYNANYAGFLAYAWGGNAMGITEAEQLEHEYYYRSRLVLHSQRPQWLSDSAINVNGAAIPLSWSQPLNWLGGVPNAAGAEVNFWRTVTANRTITLDGSKTVGTMSFDSPFTYTISAGSGGNIVFNNSGSAARLTSNQGNHTIAVGVQLTSTLAAEVTVGALTIGGVVSGPGGLIKTGAGTLALDAENSYTGDTIVQDGRLRVDHPSFADTATAFLSTGATLELNFSDSTDSIHSLFIDGVPQMIGLWGAVGNLSAEYHSSLLTGTGILQVTAGSVGGDYNEDGTVDAADYTTWRNNLGSGTALPNDDSPGVDFDDYDRWKRHFGESSGGGSVGAASAAVPEPTTASLLVLATIALSLLRCTTE
jgi:autotransporter-associated beta strand protein